MGDTVVNFVWCLSVDNHIAFVEFGDEYGSEVNGPDSVIRFIQTDGVSLQGSGEEEQLVFESERTSIGYEFDQEVTGILDGRQSVWIGSR